MLLTTYTFHYLVFHVTLYYFTIFCAQDQDVPRTHSSIGKAPSGHDDDPQSLREQSLGENKSKNVHDQ